MIALGLADLVVIAGRTLGLDTGQVLDLLDVAAAERALDQAWPRRDPGGPGPGAGGTASESVVAASEADAPASEARKAASEARKAASESAGSGREASGPGGEPGRLARRAATLLHALVRERPLRRGNQQVALAAMLQFLALNGWDTDLDPPEPVRDVIARLAAGTAGPEDVADWLAPRIRPIGRTAAREPEAARRPGLALAEKIKTATMRRQPKGMFVRFTDRSRRAVHLAQEEARLLRHDHVGPEHLLLGLLYEGEGVAAQVLRSLGISREDVRAPVQEITGLGSGPATGRLPFTPQAKKAMELSLREALQTGHHYIGTEHLLLGLIREGEGVAVQVLAGLGADHARVRERVLAVHREHEQARLAQLTVSGDLVDAAEELARVRREKEASFDAGDLDRAAALRDREKLLLADKLGLERRLEADAMEAGAMEAGPGVQAVVAENQRLQRELDRLRGLLRQHGIEPGGGTARSA